MPTEFDRLIVTYGLQLWWSRTAPCPCRNNEQTQQPDPVCALCSGRGRYHFLPELNLERFRTDAYGNPLQFNTDRTAVRIDGLVLSVTNDPQVFERFGEWLFGMARLTVQPQNRIGYRDRLQAIDAVMPWAQIVVADGTSSLAVTGGHGQAGLRFPIVTLTVLRSVSTVYEQGNDFEVSAAGGITWLKTPPENGTVLSVHQTCHPVWQVMDHVHAVRDTYVRGKRRLRPGKSGEHTPLPLQAMIKLEYLVEG